MAQVVKLHGTDAKASSRSTQAKKRLLKRGRLLGELEANHDIPLILLQAPAGYGKTTLLKQYVVELEKAGAQSCLITLASEDRCETQFYNRISSAWPQLNFDQSHLQTVGDPDQQYVLILDNYERIVGSESEGVLLKILERHFDNLRIFIASRMKPSFGITRLLLNADAWIINSEKLVFNAEEISEFLSVFLLEHSTSDVQELLRLTEGWPVAVKIACSTLSGKSISVSDLMSDNGSAWHQFHQYVDDEVLRKLSAKDQSVILDIAPLKRATFEFLSALSEVDDVATSITFLEEKGLVSLEEASLLSKWYRVHPLLASFLESLLKSQKEERYLQIHRAAVEWHKAEGRLSDAVRHAFAAGDTLVAAKLLEQASWERRRHGRPTQVGDWSEQLSDEAYEKYPLLRTEAACSFATSFAVEAAKLHANNVRKNFSDLEPLVRDDLFAVDALIKIYADNPEDLPEVSERGLRDCIVRDPYTLGSLHLAATVGYVVLGKLEKAKRSSIEAKIENDRAENVFGIAVSQMLNGLIQAVEGNLSAAVNSWKLADETIQPATKVGMVDKIAIGYLPEAMYEWNMPDETQVYLDRCLSGPIEIMLPDMVTSSYITSARLTYVNSGLEGALKVLEEAVTISIEKQWPRLSHAAEWEKVRLYLLSKNYEAAKRTYNQIAISNEFTETPGVLTHALELEANLIGAFRYEILVSPNPAIISRMKPAISSALGSGRKWRAAKLMILEAMCRKTLGDQSAALRALRSALKIGSASNLIRTFLDEGPIVVAMIRHIRNEDDNGPADISRDYLDKLMHAAGGALPELEEEPVVVETLSDRELEVLKLVFDGCSNADAARRLFVSENTVKWHLQHIYSKLGVKNRTAAVAAARVLGLVD